MEDTAAPFGKNTVWIKFLLNLLILIVNTQSTQEIIKTHKCDSGGSMTSGANFDYCNDRRVSLFIQQNNLWFKPEAELIV